jgi:hypothetical protein
MDKKTKRRFALLDFALTSRCCGQYCDGPKAPIRYERTCIRCSCIHRAMQMGLVKEVKEQYVKVNSRPKNERYSFEPETFVVPAGQLEQFSAIDGSPVG